MFRIVKHEVPCQYIREYPAATSQRQEDILKMAVNQYIPKDNICARYGDLTILAAHACGFPKELYEPLWEEIYTRTKASGLFIRGIWIADLAHQGQSGIINDGMVGSDPNWFDHARDLLHLVNVKRTEMPQPIVGIGHSIGGARLVQLSLMHPRLLHTLVLLDPVIQRARTQLEDPGTIFDHEALIAPLTRKSTYRRDKWPSRQQAIDLFEKSPAYQSWDKRVLQRWVEYGLRDLPAPLRLSHRSPTQAEDRPVTLTTPICQEVTSYARPIYNVRSSPATLVSPSTYADLDPSLITSFPFYRPEPSLVFKNLPHLRPSVMYIFAAKSHMCIPALRMDKLENTGTGVGGSGGAITGRVQDILLPDYGHLFPFEAVGECAEVTVKWLSPEMKRWDSEYATFREQWNNMSIVEKASLDKDWKKHVRRVGWNKGAKM